MQYGRLNHEQARHYRSQGYYRLLDVYSKAETQTLREFVLQQAEQERRDDRPAEQRVHKLYNLYDRQPELMHRTLTNAALVGTLVSLLGPHVVFVKNRHNHATVNNHQGEPAEGLHRDILQPTRGLITAAIYLQDSTIENGATRLIPGSQQFPYVGAPQPQGGGTWMDEHEEYSGLEDQAISIPMPEGSVLLFDGLAFHGVGANHSGDSRISITLGFRSADELDAAPDISRQIIVSGEHLYRGNDQ